MNPQKYISINSTISKNCTIGEGCIIIDSVLNACVIENKSIIINSSCNYSTITNSIIYKCIVNSAKGNGFMNIHNSFICKSQFLGLANITKSSLGYVFSKTWKFNVTDSKIFGSAKSVKCFLKETTLVFSEE